MGRPVTVTVMREEAQVEVLAMHDELAAQLRRWDVGENRVHRSFVAAAFALAGAGELVASAGVA